MNISERRATHEDYQFLFDLKVASMRYYVDKVYGWNDEVQKGFFDKDFRPDNMIIVKADGIEAGMYETSEDEEGIFLRRIEVHPIFQGKRIGTYIINKILSYAQEKSVNVWLMVFKINPAQNLYTRLGFTIAQETETHYKMVKHNKAI